jgi:hypothetical protein
MIVFVQLEIGTELHVLFVQPVPTGMELFVLLALEAEFGIL